MSDTQAALAALGQMSAFANGMRGAQTVLDALANAEQVTKELTDATVAKRAELALAQADLTKAQLAATASAEAAQAQRAAADTHFADAVDAAGRAVAATNAKGQAQAALAAEALALIHKQTDDATAALAAKTAELAALDEKINAAKYAIQKMLAP
jgi:hypothetical protein